MDIGYRGCTRTFTFQEKLFAQFTYNAGVLVAAYGLLINSTGLAVAYLLFSYIGILVVIRYTVCPRCPHLHIANDCVQLPAAIMKRIVSPNHRGPISIPEKLLLALVLYGTLLLPIYWLVANKLILVIFLMIFGGHLLGLHVHFCQKCENRSCIHYRQQAHHKGEHHE